MIKAIIRNAKYLVLAAYGKRKIASREYEYGLDFVTIIAKVDSFTYILSYGISFQRRKWALSFGMKNNANVWFENFYHTTMKISQTSRRFLKTVRAIRKCQGIYGGSRHKVHSLF